MTRRPFATACQIGSLALTLAALPIRAADLPSIDDPLHGGQLRPGDYGVTIGIEVYPFLSGMDVAYAYRDAEAVQTLLIYTLGVPPDRVNLLRGGSREQIEAALTEAGERTGPDDTVWVYFSGHGAASAEDDERLLLGDGVRQDAAQFESEGVRLDEAQRLAGAGGARVILLLDACYTGVGRDGQALAPGAKYVPHSAVSAQRGATVWSAANSNEVAGPFDAAHHSAFTYFAVGALRGWADGELDGTRDDRVTALEANQYVARALRSAGIRSQTPSVAGEGDVTLVRSDHLERGPDLVALCESSSVAPPPPDPVVGHVETSTGDTDLVAAARELERLRQERDAREARAQELEERLAKERQRMREEAEEALREEASSEWLALASLRDEGGPEAVKIVEMYLDKYSEATVFVDGHSHSVELPCVSQALAWLDEHVPGIRWENDIELSMHRASAAGKPLMFWMDDRRSGVCEELRRKTLSDPSVIAVADQFVTVHVDLTSVSPEEIALVDRYSVPGPPRVVFAHSDGRELHGRAVQGFVPAQTLLEAMRGALATFIAPAEVTYPERRVDPAQPFRADVASGTIEAGAGTTFQLHYRVDILGGHYLYQDNTSVEIANAAGMHIGETVYPAAIVRFDKWEQAEVGVYETAPVMRVPVTIPEGQPPGDYQVVARIRYRGCNDRMCFFPATEEIIKEVTVR